VTLTKQGARNHRPRLREGGRLYYFLMETKGFPFPFPSFDRRQDRSRCTVEAGPALCDGGVDRCGCGGHRGAITIVGAPRRPVTVPTGAATATLLLLLLPRPHGTRRPSCGRDIFGCSVMAWVRVWLHCLVVKFDLKLAADQRRTLEIFVQATDKLFHK
jgi:hypothetical protein